MHVVVGSSGGPALALSDRLGSGQSNDSYFTAAVTAEGFQASVGVYVHGPAGLVTYFEDLSAAWRGWAGIKAWASIEGELTIDATHDGLGHIDLAVTVRHLGRYGWDWNATVHVPLDAGAQLDETVRALGGFFPGE